MVHNNSPSFLQTKMTPCRKQNSNRKNPNRFHPPLLRCVRLQSKETLLSSHPTLPTLINASSVHRRMSGWRSVSSRFVLFAIPVLGFHFYFLQQPHQIKISLPYSLLNFQSRPPSSKSNPKIFNWFLRNRRPVFFMIASLRVAVTLFGSDKGYGQLHISSMSTAVERRKK